VQADNKTFHYLAGDQLQVLYGRLLGNGGHGVKIGKCCREKGPARTVGLALIKERCLFKSSALPGNRPVYFLITL